jgi:hypothetical protein
MTNSDALKARVGYPLSDYAIEIALTGRGLAIATVYNPTGDMTAFDLAYADAITMILTAPQSVAEGGFSEIGRAHV